MFLKSLTLKGFKSFADSTVLDLEPGVTVVVGPNGSGKSNVVDAIAWVLGAQAPKAVRSQKMDDVIFAGTEKRPALGRAEVSLTLDNSAGLLPIEFNEVTVSRVLFRSGESEYSINGVGCRLLDIQELLSDAGVGRRQHVIVSQGQIDAVLNARPEDRRDIVEEAAGVLKYRKRKEKAQRRLDSTEANLLRLQDLLREVRRQLKPLERQADAARRHGDLVVELSALKLFVAGREIAGLRTKLETIAATQHQTAQHQQQVQSELARLDTEIIDLETTLQARGVQDVSERLGQVDRLIERSRGLAGILTERRRSLERDKGQLLDAGVIANLEADAARFRDELEQVEEAMSTVAPQAADLDEQEQAFHTERQQVLAALDDADAGPKAASAAAEVRGELRSAGQSAERNERELRRVEQRHDSLRQRLDHTSSEIDELRQQCAACERAEPVLVQRLDTANEHQRQAQQSLEQASNARAQAADEFSKAEARAEALEVALDEARARAGAERLANVDGVLGTLLDLIEIDSGWERAVEAALGEALSAVVVADRSAASRALAELQSAATPGAVLTPPVVAVTAADVGVGEPVLPHVRAKEHKIEQLVASLIAGAVRVRDVEAAIHAAAEHGDAVIVTVDGDRFASTGWRVGAAGSGATAAALEQAREQAAVAHNALEAADQHLARETAAASTASEAASQVRIELDQVDSTFSAASERLNRLLAQRLEHLAEIETVQQAVSELAGQRDADRARLDELEALLPGLEAAEAAEAESARERGATRANLEARAAALAQQRHELEVRNAGLGERQQFLHARIAEAERRLDADRHERVAAETQRERIEAMISVVDGHLDAVGAHRNTLEVERTRLGEILQHQSEQVRSVTDSLDAARKRRQEAERQLEQARAVSQRAEVESAEAKLRLETAIETLRRDLDAEPGDAEAAEPPALPEGATAAGRVRELERELRLLGPINPLALEEHNELQQRHQFLEEQLDDVRSTRRDLNRVIRAVDQEIQSVFSAAFADVNANFTQLFALLFPGGSGRLKLTQPDDLLNTGIDVEAKPSGKNVKKLSLLSGGERSLTALAYLFAVFRSRPSPFYVMDEVEAALDDVNLHRFLSLTNEFRKDAQLIIVSHQKRTMEAGDSLLGVSMQPGGSSRVVTEKASVATARMP